MNELQIFTYNNAQFRTITKSDGEKWFVLKDVCDILGLDSPHKVAGRLDDDEKGRNLIPTLGGNQEMTVISESGLYNVILRSDKPEAKPFRKWVTSEVLPSIRKTGSYSTNAAAINDARSDKVLEINEINAKVRLSDRLLKIAKMDALSSAHKNALVIKAAEVLTGTELVETVRSAFKLPQKMYSAAEIGAMFGVSAQKIGRLSNEHNLKTSEYGEWYRSKSEHSNKEVDTFVYNDKAVEKFKAILG